MKQKFFFLFISTIAGLLMSASAVAQAPQAIPYQAVARSNSGNILANQLISVRFGILDSAVNGTILFKETHTITTNSLGLFTANIGQGTPFYGTINTINWGTNPKFLQVEMDAAGGNNFVAMGTTQLTSVPYALYADKSNDNVWMKSGNAIYNSNNGNVGIGILSPTSKLHTSGSVRHEGLSGSNARLLRVDAGGNLFTAQTPITSSPNINIPDNGCATGAGITNTINLSGYPAVVASSLISVKVNITHTFDADVALLLIAPNGAILKLAQNNGGGGDNFTNTVFSDNASTSISAGVAPFTGSYKPIGGLTTLCTITPTVSTFAAIGSGGVNPNGIWTLKVIDDAGSDVGVLNNWSVEIQGYSNGGINNYITKWENGTLSNTSTMYDDGTNIGIGTTSPAAQLHTTGSVRHETLSGLGKRLVFADSVGNLVTNTNASKTSAAGGNIMGNLACNSYSLTVAGAPTSVLSKTISLKVNLTHQYLYGIVILLEAPNSDIILISKNYSGPPNASVNATYTDYSLDHNPQLPYNGVYKPEGDLLGYPCVSANRFNFSNMGTYTSGSFTINPNGVWKLWIIDLAFNPGVQGNLIDWSIQIGDTINRGYDGYFPKWVSGNLSNSSSIYENENGVGIGTADVKNNLSVGGNGNVTGNLGIGILNPLARLHVGGSGTSTANLNRSYFSASTGSSIVNNTAVSGSIVIRADGWIWASSGGFVATSDKRIKNILSKTNNQNDLDVLRKIDITNYKYIDEISNGSKVQKKVIAQQVQDIYPIAINTTQGIIPNVFETALHTEIKNGKTYIETKKKHDFITGDEVKLILDTMGEKTCKVTVINENLFMVDEIIDDHIFVYGKKVNDLLTVDYDALTTLNISATQELAKQNKALIEKLNELSLQYETLKNETDSKLTVLETKLSNFQFINSTSSAINK